MMATKRLFMVAIPALAILIGSAALTARDLKPFGVPDYNPASVIHSKFIVSEFKVVPAPEPLEGAHLYVKGVSGETLDVFLGPAKYIKIFNLPLNPGDKVDVLGSEVKFKGANLVLGREVTKGAVTMILRDDTGVPMWLDWME